MGFSFHSLGSFILKYACPKETDLLIEIVTYCDEVGRSI